MEKIYKLSKEYNFKIIEDASHAMEECIKEKKLVIVNIVQ